MSRRLMSLVGALVVFSFVVAAPMARAQQAPVRVGGIVKEPTKIKHVDPVYPEEAKAAGVQGTVILELLLGTDGGVKKITVLRSIASLDDAATKAVAQWKYTPTLLNKEPVEVLMTVTVNFSLKQ